MRKVAIFTFIDRENEFLNKWIQYYRSVLPNAELIVLTDNKDIVSNLKTLKSISVSDASDLKQNKYVRDKDVFNKFQQLLLEDFDVVIYTDVDELIFHPELESLIDTFDQDYLTTIGFEIIDFEGTKIDWNKPILEQRKVGVYSDWYDKPLIVRKPLLWEDGKHNKTTPKNFVDDLYLVHLNKVDIGFLSDLNAQNKQMYSNVLNHNSLTGNELKKHIKEYFFPYLVRIPIAIKNI
jgi:hypothetical protein